MAPLTQAEVVALEDRVRQMSDEIDAARKRGIAVDVPNDYVGTLRVNLTVLARRAFSLSGIGRGAK